MGKARNIAFVRLSLADSNVLALWVCGVHVMEAETDEEKKSLKQTCKEINAAFRAGTRAPPEFTTPIPQPRKGHSIPWFRMTTM